MDNASMLLSVLQSYAPNGDAQEQCAQFKRDTERDGRNVELALVDAIHDGLAYGNWLWLI